MSFALIPLVLIVLVAGCGGEDNAGMPATEIPGGGDPGDVQVIDDWSSTLARGDVEAAAEFFAIPSVAENVVLIEIEDENDALRFNASLPCGARLIHAETQGEFTTATFRLLERPGRGTCGDGVGETAQTSFVIEDSKIVEWRRVGLAGDELEGPIA